MANSETIIRLKLRPRWRRALIAPRIWVRFYQVFHGKDGALESAWLATKATWAMVWF